MNEVRTYFEGERTQSAVGILIALSFIATAVYILRKSGTGFYKGMGYTLIAVSCLLFTFCTIVVFRSPADIRRVSGYAREAPQKIRTEELPRMEQVMKRFRVIKVVETCLVIAGLSLLIFLTDRPVVRGISAGIFILAVAMFFYDHIAEGRGEVYLQFLRKFDNK